MNPGTKLDALHAEMLGDLQEVVQLLGSLRSEVPQLMAEIKKGGDDAAAAVGSACTDFQAQAFALAEFIKKRKAEVLEDIEQSTIRNAATTSKALRTFRRQLWVNAALGALNLLLLGYLVALK
jgi:hypothetical protein